MYQRLPLLVTPRSFRALHISLRPMSSETGSPFMPG